MRAERWAPEREARLRELVAQGWSGGRIGEALGITGAAARNKANKMGLSLRGSVRLKSAPFKWVAWKASDIRLLRHEVEVKGASAKAIAARLGRSEKAVYNRLYQCGLSLRWARHDLRRRHGR
jgi:DNA-binding NarL/FixJ family response regulator